LVSFLIERGTIFMTYPIFYLHIICTQICLCVWKNF